MSETRQSVERKLAISRKHLAALEEKIAMYTELEAPMHLIMQRAMEREKIARLETLLESGEFLEADEGAMSEQEESGDVIHATISGSISGQVAVGKRITQIKTVGAARPEVTEADLAALRQVLADLKAKVAAEAPPEEKDAALERVGELEEAIIAKEPDLTTIEYVRRWFVKNLPGLAGAVTNVVGHPIVGKLVEGEWEGGALDRLDRTAS